VASQHFGIVWLDVFTSRTYCLFVYSRALAQKLVIRLSRTFRSGKLFEINTQDLLSKFYSESGKLVSEMFDKVLKMAHDEKELVCVLIDEIESIATSRQVSTKNGECTDTVRATNQLLTALDRIRNKPNIIVFCTSNLVESIVRLSLRFKEEHH
jgi:SpoVK/Ycf46/Vps4 family AAA+-type ATPase